MKVKVQESRWNNKICYLGFLEFRTITEVVNNKQDLAMNRKVRPERVEKIVIYINDNIDTVFFPPVILNSCEKITANVQNNDITEVEFKKNSLTIIDGQHRISAIKKALENSDINEKLKLKRLPFLLIENLDDSEHRNLFNLINESAANVEATVSARFKICYENMYGLRYIRTNLDKFRSSMVEYCVKDMIEWEVKQSQEKVCYIFVTELNKRFLKYIESNFDEKSPQKDYEMIEYFWDKYFSFLSNGLSDNIKSFYVKKVTLRAIVDCILGDIELIHENKAKNYDELIKKIDTVLNDLLINDLANEYEGPYKQCSDTYKEIIKFLVESYYLDSDIDEEVVKKEIAASEVKE